MSEATPRMVVVGGPSGSGKSSLFPVEAIPGVQGFNVDARCAELNGGSFLGIPPLLRARAGAECEAFIHESIRIGRSFAVETTMRTSIAVEQATEAMAHGFQTELIYIATEDVQENIKRIQARALKGEHSAPPAVIEQIYQASLDNLLPALRCFHQSNCFDNSEHFRAPRLVATSTGGILTLHADQIPRWLGRLFPGAPVSPVEIETLRLPT